MKTIYKCNVCDISYKMRGKNYDIDYEIVEGNCGSLKCRSLRTGICTECSETESECPCSSEWGRIQMVRRPCTTCGKDIPNYHNIFGAYSATYLRTQCLACNDFLTRWNYDLLKA